MHEHHEDDPEVLSEIEKLGYDPRDVPVEQTWKHAVGLFIACGVMMAAAAGIMWVIDWNTRGSSLGKPEAVQRRNVPEDPYPLLQSNLTAKTDILDLRDRERAKTDHYSWVDESKGIVRIPVEDAIQKVLEEGLPTTSSQAAPSSVTGEDPASPGTSVEPSVFRTEPVATGGGQ
jgi:hypothetical protein